MHFSSRCATILWRSENASIFPGVAKFGIALEWGSRGLEFESRHSDQVRIIRTQSSKLEMCSDFLFLSTLLFDRETAKASWCTNWPPVIHLKLVAFWLVQAGNEDLSNARSNHNAANDEDEIEADLCLMVHGCKLR